MSSSCPDNATAASPWPEEARTADVCGSTWQDAYAALHASQLELDSPRLLVFDVTGNGGIADRLTGLMTVLLIAILTDRALAIDWPAHETALRIPRLDNTRALSLARAAQLRDVRQMHWLNGNRVQLRNLTEAAPSLDELWPERVLVLRTNRGFTQGLLTSARHAAAVSAHGLSPSNAQFGCLFNFLLRPTAEALAAIRPQRAALQAAHAAGEVTVGVHVRTGDSSFTTEKAAASAVAGNARGAELYASHRFIYDYALELARRIAEERGGARASRLLLLGDSPTLRRHAAAQIGEAFILSAAEQAGGSAGSSEGGGVVVGHVARQQDARTLQGAVAEHWLYSAADAFVYSSHSGFPRTAAARALRDDAIHTCFHYTGRTFNPQNTARECTGPWSVAQLGDRHAAGL